MAVEKTRNAGLWTEARYWGGVRSALRRGFRFWRPIVQCKLDARRAKVDGGRQKWEYVCAECSNWFKGTEVEVDHTVPTGSLKCADDLTGFLERLTAEEGYRLLCKPCHKIKTNEEKEARRIENATD